MMVAAADIHGLADHRRRRKEHVERIRHQLGAGRRPVDAWRCEAPLTASLELPLELAFEDAKLLFVRRWYIPQSPSKVSAGGRRQHALALAFAVARALRWHAALGLACRHNPCADKPLRPSACRPFYLALMIRAANRTALLRSST